MNFYNDSEDSDRITKILQDMYIRDGQMQLGDALVGHFKDGVSLRYLRENGFRGDYIGHHAYKAEGGIYEGFVPVFIRRKNK